VTDLTATPATTCGARAGTRFCGQCGTPLGADARFCPSFGTPLDAGSAAPGAPTTADATGTSRTPWIVAIALSVAATAFTISAARARDGLPSNPLAANQAPVAAPFAGGGTGGTPPDISNLTPRERFARLNDRVMTAAQSGDTSTVIQFWPMAQQSYAMLPEGDRDVDARYHMATLYLLIGQFTEVLALADTIHAEAPDNLMGWYLRAAVGDLDKKPDLAREARAAFVRNYDREIAADRQEYKDHKELLEQFKNTANSEP
jgi:hypothetical protein